MRYVLSLDGGGIRGLIPALILTDLEARVGTPISDLFDLMVGTSTGGIIALGLAQPDPSGKPQHSAKTLVELYRECGPDIFTRSMWDTVTSLGALVEEKYNADGLEKILARYLDTTLLGASITPVMVTSYDIEKREPLFFKSWKQEHKKIPMTCVGRATSAAPTYFEPAQVQVENEIRSLVDGGIFMNNPSVSAYVEALRLFPGEDITLISIGTGELVRPILFEDAKGWGLASWMIPAMSCIFDGVSDAADYQLHQLLGDRYIRLQASLEHASDDLDNVTPGNIHLLGQVGQQIIEQHSNQLAGLFSVTAAHRA